MRRGWAGLVTLLFLFTASAPVWAAVPVEVLGRDLTRSERQHLLQELAIRHDVPAKIVYVEHYQEAEVFAGIAPADQIAKRAVTAVYLVPKRLGYGIHVWTRHISGVSGPMYANALTTAGVSDAAIRVYALNPVNGLLAFVDMLWGYQAATAAHISPFQKRVAARELVLTAELSRRTGEPLRVLETFRLLKEQVSEDRLTTPSRIRTRLAADANREHLALSARETAAVVQVMQDIGRLRLSAAKLHEQVAGLRSEGLQAHAWWLSLAHVWHWITDHLFSASGSGSRRRVDGGLGGSIDSRHRRELLVRP